MTPGEFQAVVLEDIIPAANPSWHFPWKFNLTVQERRGDKGGIWQARELIFKRKKIKAAHKPSAHGKGGSVTQCSHESS